MSRNINPQWANKVRDQLDRIQPIDETTAYTPAIQWIICELTKSSRAFQLYNLGAGVRRITTETDVCPFCKRNLK